jgi:hypothetical protein
LLTGIFVINSLTRRKNCGKTTWFILAKDLDDIRHRQGFKLCYIIQVFGLQLFTKNIRV